MSPPRSRDSPSSPARNKAIRIMMSRAAASPTTASVRAAAQLSATSRASRAEYKRVVPTEVQDNAFWEDTMDKLLERGKRMAAIEVRYQSQMEDDLGPITLVPDTMDLRIRASSESLVDGFIATATWESPVASSPIPSHVHIAHPMLPGLQPMELMDILGMLYSHPSFLAKDATWRGDFIVNLISGLVHGLAKAEWLHKRLRDAEGRTASLLPATSRYLAPRTWDDEDDAEEALQDAEESLARECAALARDVPISYVQAYRARFLQMLRERYP